MSVTDVRKDATEKTMTITAEFDASAERVWQVWADPRQLERWWGPPEWPATFVEHDLAPGAGARYFMTGPDGERAHGWWRITDVDEPRRLAFDDGFALESGEPNPEMPVMQMVVTLADRPGGGTRMAVETRFPSVEVMDQMVTMGMEEGMAAAIGQIDAVLAGAGTAAG